LPQIYYPREPRTFFRGVDTFSSPRLLAASFAVFSCRELCSSSVTFPLFWSPAIVVLGGGCSAFFSLFFLRSCVSSLSAFCRSLDPPRRTLVVPFAPSVWRHSLFSEFSSPRGRRSLFFPLLAQCRPDVRLIVASAYPQRVRSSPPMVSPSHRQGFLFRVQFLPSKLPSSDATLLVSGAPFLRGSWRPRQVRAVFCSLTSQRFFTEPTSPPPTSRHLSADRAPFRPSLLALAPLSLF